MTLMFAAKFYEVSRQIVLTYHLIDVIWPIINNKVWDDLGPDLQAKMYEAMKVAQTTCDDFNRAKEVELLDFFKSQGLVVTEPDIDAFQRYSFNYYVNSGLTRDWDMDLYNQIQVMAR